MRGGEIFARCSHCGRLTEHSVALIGERLYAYCHHCRRVHESGDAAMVMTLLELPTPPLPSEWQ